MRSRQRSKPRTRPKDRLSSRPCVPNSLDGCAWLDIARARCCCCGDTGALEVVVENMKFQEDCYMLLLECWLTRGVSNESGATSARQESNDCDQKASLGVSIGLCALTYQQQKKNEFKICCDIRRLEQILCALERGGGHTVQWKLEAMRPHQGSRMAGIKIPLPLATLNISRSYNEVHRAHSINYLHFSSISHRISSLLLSMQQKQVSLHSVGLP